MEDREQKLYIGLEINNKYVMISSFSKGMSEPETISRINGSEQYQIPMALGKKHGMGQWFYGEDAEKIAETDRGNLADHLYEGALAGESIQIERETYYYEDLLALFLRKVLMLPRKLGSEMEIGKLVVTLSKLNLANTRMMERVLIKAGLKAEQFQMIDNRESFYFYALSQKKELWLHDVALFEYTGEKLKYYGLSRNAGTVPQVITIEERNYGELSKDRDMDFESCIDEAFTKRIISTSYLIGEGFEGDWMKNSLQKLCRGKKAFLGKNLYSKGACFAALVKSEMMPWEFVYIGDNELKINVSLKIRDRGEMAFYSLLSAGENWYEAEGQCEVILDGKPEIDLWLQEPNSREARIQSMVLTDFPERENKTSRLRIVAKPVADDKIRVRIKDLGFGELVKSSEKVWEYTMDRGGMV